MWWITSTILDHIPLWLSLTICGVIAIVAFYFLSPILIPIWRMLPTPVRVALGTAVAIVIAILGGRYTGAKDERDKQRARDAQAFQKRNEVDNEVATLSESETNKRLRDRWSRD